MKGNKDILESLYIQYRVSEVTYQLTVLARDHEAKVNSKKRKLEAELKAIKKAKIKAENEARRNRITPDYENYETVKKETYMIFLSVFVVVIIFLSLIIIASN